MDVPAHRGRTGGTGSPHDVPLGTPLLRSESRTSEAMRFYEDADIRRACVEAVAEEGEGFFARARLAGAAAAAGGPAAHRRPLGDGRASGRRPCARSSPDAKRVIEERTNRPVLHLCYPWHAAGPTAHRLARDTGYRTAFMGKVPGTPITLTGGDPMRIARIGEDYVELLPGRGRATWDRSCGASGSAGGARVRSRMASAVPLAPRR